jgi:hypothetical protein
MIAVDKRAIVFRNSATALTVALGIGVASPIFAAELHLRESLLIQQRNRVTMTVDAEIAKIGPVHDLDVSKPMSGDDCDVHMGLSSDDLRVPFVGEIKNACSTQSPSGNKWSTAILAERNAGMVSFSGAFRIWLEHPPSFVQTESDPEPVNGSNPDHQVELHPLTQAGAIDLRPNVRWVEKDGDEGFGYGPIQFQDVLTWTIDIETLSHHGTRYVGIKGKKFKFNHWTLRARASSQAEQLADGVRIRVNILGDDGTALADDVSLLGIADTAGGTELAGMNVGQTFEFLALSTLDISKILDQVTADPQEIAVPIAFIVLDTR